MPVHGVCSGFSLLRFLLSGETNLEKFVASYRRR